MTVPRRTPAYWLAPVAGTGTTCAAATGVALDWAVDGPVAAVAPTLVVTAYTWFGVALKRRVAGNPMGWLLIAAAIPMMAQFYAEPSARRLAVPHPAAAAWVRWSGGLWILLVYLLVVLLPLVLPTGRLLSPRWRAWARFGLAFALVVGLLELTDPTPMSLADGAVLANPAAWPFLHRLVPAGLFDAAQGLWLLVLIVGGVVALVVRYRRSDHAARVAIRLVVAGLLAASLPFLSYFVSADLYLGTAVVTWPLLPLAIVVSIARYQLWELHRLFSRTATYFVVTAVLAGAYVVVVAVTSALVPESYGSAGVVLATLVAATAFGPVRRTVQQFVDRRFDRRRYDAAVTVSRFGTRMRHEVDADRLREELLDTVRRTVAPTSVDLWLARR